MTRPLVLVALLLAFVGCAAPVAVAPQPASEATTEVVDAGVIAAPMAVRIPAVGAESSLIELGLDPQGAMAVPPVDQPWQASWYRHGNSGVIPGSDGPAVIAGHVSGQVDGRSVPGVFARLAELAPGDEVWVDRYDAPPLPWTVTQIQSYPKDAFPTDAVWGDTDGPELRLVTCGGVLQTLADGHRSYSDNIVVFAVPA